MHTVRHIKNLWHSFLKYPVFTTLLFCGAVALICTVIYQLIYGPRDDCISAFCAYCGKCFTAHKQETADIQKYLYEPLGIALNFRRNLLYSYIRLF